MAVKKLTPMVVTTAKRGVFFGLGVLPTSIPKELRLTNAQMAVYWSARVKGVLGLASNGPAADCRITKPIPAITVNEITSIMEATPEAAEAWAKSPWS